MSQYIISQYIISNELYHHGILGQKWGVRKYQNEDGTLTSAGKTRYWGKKGDIGEYKPVSESSNRKEFDARSPRDMSAKEMQIASQYYNNYANYLNSRSRIKDAETPAGIKALKNAGRKVGDDVYKQLSKYIIAGTAATAGAFLVKKMKDVNWSSLKDKIMSGANAAKNMVSVVGDMVPRNYTTLSIGHADILDGINFGEITVNYLVHHGILGQKWGVRRYQNEDGTRTAEGKERYSAEQSNRDKAVYGRFAERRIAKRVNSGASVSEARAKEADRINRFRKTANNVKRQEVTNTTAIAGAIIGGAVARPAMKAAKGLVNHLAWSNNPIGRFLGAHRGTINRGIDFMNDKHLTEVLGAGIGGLTGKLLPHQVSSGVMISGGYSPSKRR